MGRLYRLWRRRTADVLGALLVIVVAGGAAAAFVLPPARNGRSVDHSPSVAELPACRKVDLAPAADRRARCRDGTAAVELVSARTQLVLDDLAVRVLDVERRHRTLSVRLRFGNRSTVTRIIRDDRRQIYIDGSGRRIYGRMGRTLRIDPQSEVTATYRFDEVAIAQGGTRGVLLGVVPFAEVARAHPSHLGAIQLDLPPNGRVLDRSRPQTAATGRRPTRRARRQQPQGAPASRQMVRLTLVATAPVYVCLRAGQRVLVPCRLLQSGERAGPFRARRFTMTLGNAAIRMRLDGGPPIEPSGAPSAYVVDRRGARALPLGRLPACGA
jgi:hypothetical protein